MSGGAVSEVEEPVARRYEIKRRLGKGAYGIVWKAVDRKTGAIVAVKKIFDAFRNRTDAQVGWRRRRTLHACRSALALPLRGPDGLQGGERERRCPGRPERRGRGDRARSGGPAGGRAPAPFRRVRAALEAAGSRRVGRGPAPQGPGGLLAGAPAERAPRSAFRSRWGMGGRRLLTAAASLFCLAEDLPRDRLPPGKRGGGGGGGSSGRDDARAAGPPVRESQGGDWPGVACRRRAARRNRALFAPGRQSCALPRADGGCKGASGTWWPTLSPEGLCFDGRFQENPICCGAHDQKQRRVDLIFFGGNFAFVPGLLNDANKFCQERPVIGLPKIGNDLKEFGEHPNIIKLLNVIRAQNDKDIYLVFESMETDLHAVIKKGNLLKDIHKCYILYQLLKATKFIHSGNVIHRDQKLHQGGRHVEHRLHPRGDASGEAVVSRLLHCQPDRADPASYSSPVPRRQRVTFEEFLPASTHPQALDLLKRLLVFNPEKRLTAEEALEHPYVQRFHCPTREPTLRSSVILPLDDDVQLSVAEYRNKLYEMILEKKAQNKCQKLQQQQKNLQPSPLGTSYPLQAHWEPQAVPGPFPPHACPGALEATAPCAAHSRRASEARTPGLRPKISSAAVHGGTAPGGITRNRSAPFLPQPQQHEAAASLSWQARRQGSCLPVSALPATVVAVPGGVPPPHGVPCGLEGGIPAPWPSSLSAQAHQVALHQPLTRKESSLSKAAIVARENPRSSESHGQEVPPFLKPGKKLFQGTANVGAAGDPKAHLGSYSQSYGTICKSALQSLPVASVCQQGAAP